MAPVMHAFWQQALEHVSRPAFSIVIDASSCKRRHVHHQEVHTAHVHMQ